MEVWQYDEEDDKQLQKVKKFEHSMVILKYAEFFNEQDQVEIRLSDGNVKMPWLVLASLSPIFKEYLDFIDKSTILEPLVIIPELKKSDLLVLKKYIFSVELPNAEEYFDTFLKTIDHIGMDKSAYEEEKKPKVKPKRVPSIISRSRNDFSDCEDNDFLIEEGESSAALSCPYCSKVYSHLKARNKHMISEHLKECKKDNAYFPCSICPAIFVSLLGKDKHSKRMHPSQIPIDSGLIPCPFPHYDNLETYAFAKLKEFHAHIKEYHPDKDKSCIGCGQSFDSSKDLEAHIQNHKIGQPGSKPFFFCEHCGLVLLREYALVMHKRNQHPTVATTLECQYCGKDFKNAKFLKTHEDKHRKGQIDEDQHICQICGKSFTNRLNLNRHIKTFHQKIKDHQCPECGKNFVDSTRLKEHRWIHTDHKPHKCRFCDQTFRHKNHVKHHEAKVHGEKKQFECELCQKTFCYAYELKNHAKNHANKKNKNQVVSAEPNNPMETLDAELTRHIFECSICQKQFPSIPSLKAHCTQHTQEELARGALVEQGENTFTISSADEIKPETEHILLEVESMEETEEQSFVIEFEN